MRTIAATTHFFTSAFLFLILIISFSLVNAADHRQLTISPTQEQNYQEFLQLVETFESPEKGQLTSLTTQIHEAILSGDHDIVFEKVKEFENLHARLPSVEQQAITQFVNAHEVEAEPEVIESSKQSYCSVSNVLSSCEILCPSGYIAECGCTLGLFAWCHCYPEGPATTQWGIIVLIALLISSAIYIMLKKRKAAVPA